VFTSVIFENRVVVISVITVNVDGNGLFILDSNKIFRSFIFENRI
jgi:hypothetical protein